jgi:UDP-N-acetyl-D-mannosaminuronate dehydrogenase
MASHVLNLISDSLKSIGKELSKSTVLILGVSYKPNVKDIQITPAEPVIKKLLESGTKIKIYDPYFKSMSVFNILVENNLSEAISNIDAAVLITAHDEFKHIDPTFLSSKSKPLVVVDTRGIIDIPAARKAGLIIRGIGRGGK